MFCRLHCVEFSGSDCFQVLRCFLLCFMVPMLGACLWLIVIYVGVRIDWFFGLWLFTCFAWVLMIAGYGF